MFLYAWRTCFISTPSNSPSFHSQHEVHVKNEPAGSSLYSFSPRRPRRLVEIVMTSSRDALGEKKREKSFLGSCGSSHALSHVDCVASSA